MLVEVEVTMASDWTTVDFGGHTYSLVTSEIKAGKGKVTLQGDEARPRIMISENSRPVTARLQFRFVSGQPTAAKLTVRKGGIGTTDVVFAPGQAEKAAGRNAESGMNPSKTFDVTIPLR